MLSADKPLPAWKGSVPVFVCAAGSAVLMQSGFWSFLFLIPLGAAALIHSPRGGWTAWAVSLAAHAALTFVFSRGVFLQAWIFNAVISLGFMWIMAGGQPGLRTAYRFVCASGAGAAVFFRVFLSGEQGALHREIVREQAELLSRAYVSAAGVDAVQQTVLEQALSPDNLVNFMTAVILRGGAVVFCLFHFFLSRQAAFILAGLFQKRRYGTGLRLFHAPAAAIWVLSAALGLILLFRRAGLEAPEIAAWNVLVMCGVLFLAQGAGIALHAMSRWRPAARSLCTILFIAVVLSPGINAAALGGLILLGIAENWLPLRAAKPTKAA